MSRDAMKRDGSTGAGAAGGDRTDALVAIGLAAVALVCVVAAIGPFPVGVYQDDGLYTILGRSLASGEGYRFTNLPGAPNATHYPPLYPLFLALLWKVSPAFPGNVTLFKFANAALVALAAAGSYVLARRRVGLDRLPAAVAAGAFTACTPVVFLSVMVLSEPMFLAALAPVLLVAERAADTGRSRDALLAGAAGASLALIRTLGVVVIPATALVLAWRRRWLAAALVLAAGVALLLPWQLWVSAHAGEVPAMLAGKYGSYGHWFGEAIRAEGAGWVARIGIHNLQQLVSQGWSTVGVEAMGAPVRWTATLLLALGAIAGWWRLARVAPVVAWAMALYLALVVVWPFAPARFTWAIWPLVGITFVVAADQAWRWRPVGRMPGVLRTVGLAGAVALAVGYARYNQLNVSSGWWSEVQSMVANRARPLAEWVDGFAPPDAVIATDDDTLIHLYTGRLTIPNGTFTPQEHLEPQTPAYAASSLREILAAYPVDFVLASSEFGTYAAAGLVRSEPPALRLLGALSIGAVFAPVRADSGRAP